VQTAATKHLKRNAELHCTITLASMLKSKDPFVDLVLYDMD